MLFTKRTTAVDLTSPARAAGCSVHRSHCTRYPRRKTRTKVGQTRCDLSSRPEAILLFRNFAPSRHSPPAESSPPDSGVFATRASQRLVPSARDFVLLYCTPPWQITSQASREMNSTIEFLSWTGVHITPWKIIGMAGAVMFGSRWIVQFLASRKQGRPTIPRLFWYMSLAGSAMTLAYFLFSAKRDSVGVLQNLLPALTSSYSLWLDLKMGQRATSENTRAR